MNSSNDAQIATTQAKGQVGDVKNIDCAAKSGEDGHHFTRRRADMIPKTNESFYEINWGVRAQLIDQLIAQGVNDIHDLLLRFDQTERRYWFGLETATKTDGSGEIYLTGNVKISENKGARISRDLSHIDAYLQPVVHRITPDVSCVVELGCGYGRNLFMLNRLIKRPDMTYIAAEYTRSGRDLAQKLAERFLPLMKFSTAFVDHKDPVFDFMPSKGKVLVFTSHSIEQVIEIPVDYFSKICTACEDVIGLHLEPFGYQIPEQFENTRDHAAFMKRHGYNANFYDRLCAARDRYEIDIVEVTPHISALQAENPTSLAVWAKRR